MLLDVYQVQCTLSDATARRITLIWCNITHTLAISFTFAPQPMYACFYIEVYHDT